MRIRVSGPRSSWCIHRGRGASEGPIGALPELPTANAVRYLVDDLPGRGFDYWHQRCGHQRSTPIIGCFLVAGWPTPSMITWWSVLVVVAWIPACFPYGGDGPFSTRCVSIGVY